MWPDDKWIGGLIFAFGTLTLILSVGYWFFSNYRPRTPWVTRSKGESPPAPSEETIPPEQLDKFGSPTISTSPPTLERGLYVADIRLTFDALAKDRNSEITMRVFNGSGRVVDFGGISGHIKFSAPNTNDPTKMGDLPTPTFSPDSARTVLQVDECMLIVRQPVPASEANKILKMRKNNPINFDLSGLTIEVFPHEDKVKVERLPLWGGVSCYRGIGFSKIINLVARARLRNEVADPNATKNS